MDITNIQIKGPIFHLSLQGHNDYTVPINLLSLIHFNSLEF